MAPATQTMTSPVAAPRKNAAAESRKRNGVSLQPAAEERAGDEPSDCRSAAPANAPTRPASGVHAEREPPVSRCGASREPA